MEFGTINYDNLDATTIFEQVEQN
uniref:Uncharacterized protein n=1 Tax=Arundo donax TaxID=35708 RepID=A0A0A9HRA4_ARUDO